MYTCTPIIYWLNRKRYNMKINKLKVMYKKTKLEMRDINREKKYVESVTI